MYRQIVCYAHEDDAKKAFEGLALFFQSMKKERNSCIPFSHNGGTGEQQKKEFLEALENADLFILVISSDVLCDGFYNTRIAPFVKDHPDKVVLVRYRAVSVPREFASYPCFPEKPAIQSRSDKDSAWAQATQELGKIVGSLPEEEEIMTQPNSREQRRRARQAQNAQEAQQNAVLGESSLSLEITKAVLAANTSLERTRESSAKIYGPLESSDINPAVYSLLSSTSDVMKYVEQQDTILEGNVPGVTSVWKHWTEMIGLIPLAVYKAITQQGYIVYLLAEESDTDGKGHSVRYLYLWAADPDDRK